VVGGSGFLGAWILKELRESIALVLLHALTRNIVERGFNVRAAVRNESKAIYLRDAFKTYSDKLELVIVEDITIPGAFDEAVKGVTGIIHSASPLSGNDPLIDPKALIEPAVNGTVGILNSAQKSPSVERVVVTSSVTALWDRTKQLPFVYTEDVWNIPAIKIVEEQGKEAPLFTKYAASKTLAEQSAWQLIKDTNPQFDLVTVLPSFIWGQIISETTADIKGSNGRLLRPLKREEQDKYKGEALLEELYLVDVRDVSKLHVDALVIPAAGGQRIVASAATITVQHICKPSLML